MGREGGLPRAFRLDASTVPHPVDGHRSGWNVFLDLIVPAGAIAICGYTLYKSIFPTPPYTGIVKWAPWVALIWLGIGIVIDVVLTIRSPERVRRFGSILGSSEGATGDVPEGEPMPAS